MTEDYTSYLPAYAYAKTYSENDFHREMTFGHVATVEFDNKM